jgi:hypothetical protein
MMPAAAYVAQLVQLVPGLIAMLKTIKTAPGDWMHIIGMERAPTVLAFHVVQSCGAYWITAKVVERTPRKVAQSMIRGDG